jgi:hypothetical protein
MAAAMPRLRPLASFRIALLLPLLCVAASPASMPDRLLAAHNAARKAVGSPPLRWNAKLAQDAQIWARYLAATGKFEHARRTGGQGENLWSGSKGGYALEEMVGAWTAEKVHFRRGRLRADDAGEAGHYTQMIWSTTTQLGCAIATGVEDDVLVCRYSPAGNVIGRDSLERPAGPR